MPDILQNSSLVNAYFFVGDQSPGTQVFSTATGAYVVLADATYLSWLAAGNTTLWIDTEANLYAEIDRFNQANAEQFNGYAEIAMGTGHVTLTTSELQSVLQLNGTGSGTKNLTLPIMNIPGAPPIGFNLSIINNNTAPVAIKNAGGSTLATLPPGSGSGTISYVAKFCLAGNTVQNGIWAFLGIVPKDNYAAAVNGSILSSGQFIFDPAAITPGQTSVLAVKDGDGTLAFTTDVKQMHGIQSGGLSGGSTVYGFITALPTEAAASMSMPFAGTIDAIFATANPAPGGSDTLTLTVRKNAADTAVTCTITGAGIAANDVAHSFSFAAGDLIAIKFANSATSATTRSNVAIRINPI